MLVNEAIRLAFRQEQNHDSSQQPVASTHDRGHADAQVLAQDPERVYPCRAGVYRIPGEIGRLRTFEDLVHKDCDVAMIVESVHTVPDQAVGLPKIPRTYRSNSMLNRE